MNQAHLHLILVHIPVVLTPAAALVLAFGLMKRQGVVTSVAHTLLIVAALICIPAFLLGEGAEEIVEHLPGISEDTIEEHEEIAEKAVWLSGILGASSLLCLALRNRAVGLISIVQPATLLLALVTSGILAYTAFEGGKIRHPEAYSEQAEEHKE